MDFVEDSSTSNGSSLRHILDIVPSPLPLFSVPSSGPPSTIVSIEGIWFPDVSELSCLFGGVVVSATFISASQISCVVPDQPLDSIDALVPLSVILAGSNLDLSHEVNAIEFQYNPMFRVFAIFPLYGPATGSTVITVQGSHFPAFQQLVCVFGGFKEVPAVFIHSGEVQCVTPKHTPGTASIMLKVDGVNGEQEVTNQTPHFTFVDISTLQAVAEPSSGPETGGTWVRVTFAGAMDFLISLKDSIPYCMFGDSKASAHWWQDDLIGESKTAALTCISPQHPKGAVALSVYVSESVGPIIAQSLFLFEPIPVISSVVPSHITARSGTSVRMFMHGTGFRNSPFLQCQINISGGQEGDAIIANGTWISPELIWCDLLTDTAEIISAAYSSLRLQVSVTNNGQEYSPESLFATVAVDLPWTLLGIWPTYGPNIGGTLVSVVLTGHPWHQLLKQEQHPKITRCKFGSAEPVPAVLSEDCPPPFVSSLLEKRSNGCYVLLCKSPPSQTLGDVAISVSLDGGSNFWGGNQGIQFSFSYVEPLLVKNSTPATGPTLGGTHVSVHLWQRAPMALSKALTLGGPWCSFGDVVVPAVLHSSVVPQHEEVSGNLDEDGSYNSTTITCVSPPLALESSDSSHPVNLLISSNTIDFVGSATYLRFTYQAPPTTTGLWPRVGSEMGGAHVRVSGKGFHQSSSLSCIIRQLSIAVAVTAVQSVPAIWISDSEVLCVMPPHMPGPVEVLVTTSEEMVLNGSPDPFFHTWQKQSGLLFTYFPRPTISKVMPAAGLLEGGTLVSVFGSSFYNRYTTFCIFGDSWVQASYVSSSHLECVSPPAPLHLMSPLHEVQVTMSVGYSNNNGSLLQHPILQNDVLYTYFSRELIILVGVEVSNSNESSGRTTRDEHIYMNAVLRLLPRAGGSGFEQRVIVEDPSLRCVVNANANATHTAATSTISSPVEISTDGLLVKCALPPLQSTPLHNMEEVSQHVTSISLALDTTSGFIQEIGNVDLNGTELKPWAVVSSVFPSFGSALGGTPIEVHIEQLPPFSNGFHPHHNAACLFGSLSVPAIWINRGVLWCISPAMPPAQFSFTVDGNAGAPSLLALSSVEFDIVPPSITLSVIPDNAPSVGGTPLVVRGTGFLPTVGLSCVFGSSNPVPAMFISNNEVRCSTPSLPPISTVLWVSLIDGKDLGEAGRGGIPFTFHHTPVVSYIHPMFGYVHGGTPVTISGFNLPSPHDSPMCIFSFPEGQVAVPAEVRQNNTNNGEVGLMGYSESEVICISPPSYGMRSGWVPLELAGSDGTVTTSGKSFHYSPPVLLTGLFPSASTDGSNLPITFSGIGFPATTNGWCRFRLNNGTNDDQEVRTPVVFKSDVKLMCSSPEWPYPIVDNDLSLLVDIVWDEYGEENAARPVLSFILHPSIKLWSTNPSSSGPDGGSMLSVQAANLPQDRKVVVACIFGSFIGPIPAVVVSAKELRCIIPSSQGFVGRADVSIMCDGVVCSSTSAEFYYLDVGTAISEGESEPIETTTRVLIAPSSADPMDIMVTITGVRWLDNAVLIENIECVFTGETVVKTVSVPPAAVEIDKNVVICPLPEVLNIVRDSVLVPQRASVKVVSTGISTPLLSFPLLPVPIPISYSPHGGSEMGGQYITVIGRGFLRNPLLSCSFDDLIVPGWLREDSSDNYISPTTTPGNMEHPTESPIFELLCEVPRHSPGVASLEISNDGHIFTSSGMQYTYFERPVVNEVYPSTGSPEGMTLVTLKGTHLAEENLSRIVDSSGYSCFFGDIEVQAVSITDGEIACISPPAMLDSEMGSVVTVTAGVSGSFDPYHSIATYTYESGVMKVLAIKPSEGDIGSRVLVEGVNFADHPELTCIFGNEISPKVDYVSQALIICYAPPQPVGSTFGRTVKIFLSSNGIDRSHSEAYFKYESSPTITHISPALGLTSGGTVVFIVGSGFRDSVDLSCRFGGISSPGVTFLGAESILAIAPPHPQRTVDIYCSNTGGSGEDNDNHISWSTILPSDTFQFVPDPSVLEVFPKHVLTWGGTPLWLVGTNFFNSTELACRIGGIVVQAFFVSSEVISCLTPAHDAQPRLLRTIGRFEIEVTLNGIDFTDSGTEIVYYSPGGGRENIKGHYASLATGLLTPSPNGTLANSSVEYINAYNFTLCNPGTFQPSVGKTSCLPCPVGYFCPDLGLSSPVPCTAGSVCESMGLIWPSSQCPPGHYCPPVTKSQLSDGLVGPGNGSGWVLDPPSGEFQFNVSESSRSWAVIVRSPPAIGFDKIEYEPSNSSVVVGEVPLPCPHGFYCGSGVAVGEAYAQEYNFSTPQKCLDVFFCPAGSETPQGSGPCPTGYYCPNPSEAIACPAVHFCPGMANVSPKECLPGTYQSLAALSNCTLCPEGYICPGWGRILPEL